MIKSRFIRRVVVEFSDGIKDEIDDEYRINQIGGLFSLVTLSEEEEIKQILNEESKNGRY